MCFIFWNINLNLTFWIHFLEVTHPCIYWQVKLVSIHKRFYFYVSYVKYEKRYFYHFVYTYTVHKTKNDLAVQMCSCRNRVLDKYCVNFKNNLHFMTAIFNNDVRLKMLLYIAKIYVLNSCDNIVIKLFLRCSMLRNTKVIGLVVARLTRDKNRWYDNME